MTFREATDLLGLPHADLARTLGVSVQRIRQARLTRGADGYRPPPAGWETTIARLLRERGRAMLERAEELERRAR